GRDRVRPHHPAHPHRRREVRRGEGQHRRGGDRRPGVAPRRPRRPPGERRQAAPLREHLRRRRGHPVLRRPRRPGRRELHVHDPPGRGRRL
ncbi:MAG: Sulfur/cysteine carrier protein CysO, partial [uncultured Pseudonocardia sp.]